MEECGITYQFLQMSFIIITILIMIFTFKILIDNTKNFQEECYKQNKTIIHSFNYDECGCKFYNLCDRGCMLCINKT